MGPHQKAEKGSKKLKKNREKVKKEISSVYESEGNWFDYQLGSYES